MGLNRACEEGNLTASDECPVTYVSLSHTNGHQHHHAAKVADPSAPAVGPGIRGPWSLSFTMAGHRE